MTYDFRYWHKAEVGDAALGVATEGISDITSMGQKRRS
jgi:hypothetical protein